MENNFELEEMKQQWATLQTALNSQKEVNVKLILKDAKKQISWSKNTLRSVSLLLIVVLPFYLSLFPNYGVPQPIYIAFILFIIGYASNTLYMSFIVKTPNDSNIDIVRYGKSLVRLKKRYILSEVIATIVLITIAIWAVITMGFDITHPVVIGMTIGTPIGLIIGISITLKFLNNIKELQSNLDLIEKLQE